MVKELMVGFGRFGLVATLCVTTFANAGFLELPDTQEVPEYEEKTMRLDLDIPNVRERDPDPMGGPRLNVKEFRVQGIVEYPELGLTREALIKRVEQIRFDLMQEGELLESGYTVDEVSEVSDLLAEIEEDTKGEHVTAVEVQRLVFLIREQRRNRGVTLGMIESVADVITRYYREAGFILAKAYIPEQHVRDGVVTLTLLLGELGEVSVNENKRHSDWIIGRVFKSALGKPVTAKGIEERLYLVNDYPGISSRGYFEPGSQVGDTKLNVNVVNEKWFDSNVRLDNHGAEGSGKYRLYSDFFLHSPFGLADQLQLGLLASFEPDNSNFGQIRYQTNILHPRIKLYAGASTNEFTLDQTVNTGNSNQQSQTTTSYAGESLVTDFGITYKIKRSRVSNHAIDLNGSRVSSQYGLAEQQSYLEDTLKITALTYSFDTINERARRLHQAAFTLKEMKAVDGSFAQQEGGDEAAYIFAYDYSLLTFLPLPFTEKESRILVRSSGQYSEKSLASSVQFGIGGPTKSRAYAVNRFFGDYGVYLGADWQFDGFGGDKLSLFGRKLSDVLQPYLFTDMAYSYKYPLQADSDEGVRGSYADAGFGLKLNIQKMRFNMSFAKGIVAKYEASFDVNEEDTEKGSKFYFDMQYSF
ncbi:ShlB/FhaC/HecB family hemolysin secretion/activation protein [Teredinibacter turnerae]|nr:ShlB/FhaC/HecB family hemolysin secretion/activation protein [Teredinibacter turnerae]